MIPSDCNTAGSPQTPGLNPFLPFGTYIPDGEPKVFGDRVYLYGSYDRFHESYCSNCYHVVSAPTSDLTRWTDHGVSFTVDAVPWSDALLYAPDALYYKGTYYLFFCLSDGTEGVAESDSPAGPFGNAKQITLNGEPIKGIDPSVLEDRGKVYYTWGQFQLNMAELEEDLCTLKPETVHADVLSNAPGREGFHEGSSLRKFGDRFCLIYASEYVEAYPNRGGRPTKLDYALSDNPYGPYERRGTVIDNEGCDPSSWNNHGSVIRIGSEWFVFYHASSNNSEFSRRARVERLSAEESAGIINQAKPTTNGFVRTLLPDHIHSPVNADRFYGGAYVTQTADGRFPCVGLKDGAGFSFSPVSFEAGDYTVTVCYKSDTAAVLHLLLGDAAAHRIALPVSRAYREIQFEFETQSIRAPVRIGIEGPGKEDSCEISSLSLLKKS